VTSQRPGSAAAARAERGADLSAKSVAEFRDALRKNLIRPLDLVMLSRDRIDETLGDAVERGRMTADDAQELAAGLIERGRRQTNELLKDLETLLDRSRTPLGSARDRVEGAARGAGKRARDAADPAIAQADRVRRAARVGPTFPIDGYDDLKAQQVQSRLERLSPAELRKVRDHERRHANWKTVLNAIEQKLA
jgi:polyhydroxyalkanoate synthesis regulator phasin